MEIQTILLSILGCVFSLISLCIARSKCHYHKDTEGHTDIDIEMTESISDNDTTSTEHDTNS